MLVAPPPGRPSQAMPGTQRRLDDHRAEEAGDLVAGQRDLPGRCWVAGVLGAGGNGQERQGEHGQGGPPVPGPPAADLVLIQPGQALASLEVLLGDPPDSGDLDQDGQRDVPGAVAAVERQLGGAAVAADQQPAVTGTPRIDASPGPVVTAVALGTLASRILLPRSPGQAGGDLVPLENRILGRELRFLGCQAARTYSLIRPLRTGFRRIWRAWKCPAVMQGGWCSASGTRWPIPWCGRAVL